MQRQLDIFQALHDPCLVRHFLACCFDGEASLRSFIETFSPEAGLMLIHQSAIELAFHPHMTRSEKLQLNARVCAYVRSLPPSIRRIILGQLELILNRLLIFAGLGQELDHAQGLSAAELAVWLHDELIDAIFGLNHQQVEQRRDAPSDQDAGLQSVAINTSYLDFYRIFSKLPPDSRWCDIGCGMGRSLLLAATVFPRLQAVGLERCPDRIRAFEQAKTSLGYHSIELQSIDMAGRHWELPAADSYFLYLDVGAGFKQVMQRLNNCQYDYQVFAIESHGDLVPILRHCFPWLHLMDSPDFVSSPRTKLPIWQFRSGSPALASTNSRDLSAAQLYEILSDRDQQSAWIAIYRDHALGFDYAVSLLDAQLIGIDGELALHCPRADKILSLQAVAPYSLLAIQRLDLLSEAGVWQALTRGHRPWEYYENGSWKLLGRLEKLRLTPSLALEGSHSGFVELARIRRLRVVEKRQQTNLDKAALVR